eukprot:CAMPEP_0118900930 /NCGR_PEP_ID=MMETSP1166-20130328/6837_1 /TAXON_ID=1104430 /ORGANISM="Chrysoreinhardia sp, Strain CCMP3193" /LENGTH=255 /DNA_ID=CAMNT_0006840085 /DNA_START=17 /DNA_END=784 /DNA_ORIENTATION=+
MPGPTRTNNKHVGNDRSSFVAVMALLAGSALIVIGVTMVVELLTQRDAREAATSRAVKVRVNDSLTNVLDLKTERREGGGDHIGKGPGKAEFLRGGAASVISTTTTTSTNVSADDVVVPSVEEPQQSEDPPADRPMEDEIMPPTMDEPPPLAEPEHLPDPSDPEEPNEEPETSLPAELDNTEEDPTEVFNETSRRRLVGQWCRQAKALNRVRPGRDWGTLPHDQRDQWLDNDCDRFFCKRDAMSGRGTFDCKPRA